MVMIAFLSSYNLLEVIADEEDGISNFLNLEAISSTMPVTLNPNISSTIINSHSADSDIEEIKKRYVVMRLRNDDR